jgi:peroxiredoxin family protein
MAVAMELPAAEAAEKQPQTNPKLTIVLSSGDLEKVWAALIIATAGAAMGKETSIFFTFWGFFPLVKNEVRITGENWMQKMLSLMNRGGDEHLKLGKMNFAGAGPAMMKHLAQEHHAALPHELMESAREMGVRLVPCQMSMDLLGLKREDLIDGLEEPIGATTMLALAEGATTFFI